MAYFVMIGHSFGWSAAVYNYNRRARLLDELGRVLLFLVSFAFFDDKYGFELHSTVDSAFHAVQHLHTWLGIAFDTKKLQLGSMLTILGVQWPVSA